MDDIDSILNEISGATKEPEVAEPERNYVPPEPDPPSGSPIGGFPHAERLGKALNEANPPDDEDEAVVEASDTEAETPGDFEYKEEVDEEAEEEMAELRESDPDLFAQLNPDVIAAEEKLNSEAESRGVENRIAEKR